MTTFELANYPAGTTSWEVYLDGVPVEKNVTQGSLVSNGSKGELIVTLFQENTPVWRWVGALPANISSTQRVQINPKEGKVCLVESKPQVKGVVIADILKVGTVLSVVGLILGKSRVR